MASHDLQSHSSEDDDQITTVDEAKDFIANKEIEKFFKLCYNIYPPFKVLMDASFFTYLHWNNITRSDFANLFCGVEHLLYTTRHTIEHLKDKPELSDCIKEASCLTARCDNKLKCLNDSECIQVLVDSGNPQFFIVASDDQGLKRKLEQMVAVPLVQGRHGSLQLCLPSQEQINQAIDRRNNGPRQVKYRKRNRASSERNLREKQVQREQDTEDFIQSLYDTALTRELKEKKGSDNPEETVLETKINEAEPAPKPQKKRKIVKCRLKERMQSIHVKQRIPPKQLRSLLCQWKNLEELVAALARERSRRKREVIIPKRRCLKPKPPRQNQHRSLKRRGKVRETFLGTLSLQVLNQDDGFIQVQDK